MSGQSTPKKIPPNQIVNSVQPERPAKAVILIIDDNPININLLTHILVRRGYEIRSANSGPHALAAIRDDLPDLILLDIMMPDMDGYEVCAQLKAAEQTRDIPIIFISALDATKDKIKGFNVGGVDYITKPFQFAEVLARVQTHLTLRSMQRTLQDQNIKLEQEIRERVRAEEQLRQYAADLETRNAELDAFAHTVAHDLKNPLTALITTGYLLENNYNKLSKENLNLYARMIVNNGRMMNNIIDELLLLSSVREIDEIETQPLDMDRIVTNVRDRLAFSVEEHQAEIVLPDHWPVALGYGPWIEEVWANYISNAVKYGGQPPRAELGGTTEADGWVRFWVRDNGLGLTPEEQEQLFTPFERLHQVRVEGHGLGLSIVQRIVEKLGGQVGVESTVGQGSVFFFTLPGA